MEKALKRSLFNIKYITDMKRIIELLELDEATLRHEIEMGEFEHGRVFTLEEFKDNYWSEVDAHDYWDFHDKAPNFKGMYKAYLKDMEDAHEKIKKDHKELEEIKQKISDIKQFQDYLKAVEVFVNATGDDDDSVAMKMLIQLHNLSSKIIKL